MVSSWEGQFSALGFVNTLALPANGDTEESAHEIIRLFFQSVPDPAEISVRRATQPLRNGSVRGGFFRGEGGEPLGLEE